jgi:hypothetical protein
VQSPNERGHRHCRLFRWSRCPPECNLIHSFLWSEWFARYPDNKTDCIVRVHAGSNGCRGACYRRRVCRVGILAINSMASYGGIPPFATPEGRKWVDVLDRYALPDTPERAWADLGLAAVKIATGESSTAVHLFREGASLARKFGDNQIFPLAWRATRVLVPLDAGVRGGNTPAG